MSGSSLRDRAVWLTFLQQRGKGLRRRKFGKSANAAFEGVIFLIGKPLAATELYLQGIDGLHCILIGGTEWLYRLNPDSRYLSFNYTDTLETEYGITPNQVTRIHGSRLNDEEYIIGHNNNRNPSSVWDDDGLTFEQQAYENIIVWMNEFTKQYDRNIANHSSILKVYLIGQSIIGLSHHF